MRYEKTFSYTLRKPEVVLNLWAYAGEDGYVIRLAGKAYVLDGDDEDKLDLLRELARTDFLSSPWQKVPENFSLKGPGDAEMLGVAHASMLSEPASHAHLFGSLMDDLAKSLPVQMRSVEGEYVQFKLDLSEEPLTVTTLIVEYEDGRLVPMISGG